MNKLTNDEKIKISKYRKNLRIVIIIFIVLTIALAMLSLMIKLNPIFSLISFMIEVCLTKYRDKLDYKKNN